MRRMLQRASTHLWMSGAMAATAALALGFAGCSDESELSLTGESCVSNSEFFAQTYFRVIKPKCAGCHAIGGIGAEQSDFELRPSSEAGFLENNLSSVRDVASTTKGDLNVFLEKPLATEGFDHPENVFRDLGKEDPDYKMLEEMVRRLDSQDSCPDTEARFLAGAQLLGPTGLVHKAALALAARLPTQEELDLAEKGGWPAVDKILDNYLEDPAFYMRVKEKYNDITLTDQYMNDAGAISSDNYDPRWYEDPAFLENPANIAKYGASSSEDLRNKAEMWTSRGIAQASLELLVDLIKRGESYQKMVTADYIMVNPFSARAFKIPVADQKFVNDADPNEFIRVKLGGYESDYPHAGVLSDPTWLQRHPTTPTNRNRHRAKEIMYLFLGNDILKAADRPLVLDESLLGNNPTMSASGCTVCHSSVDPIAAAWQNFQFTEDEDVEQFTFRPDFAWYADMRDASFDGNTMPPDYRNKAVVWLGQQIANADAFSVAGVQMGYRVLTGNDPVPAPVNVTDDSFDGQLVAYLGQYYTFGKIGQKFRDSGFNYKVMIKELVMSPYFRAVNTAPDIAESQAEHLAGIGTGHLLTPEQLNRKLTNVLGMRWTPDNNLFETPNLLSDGGGEGYKILFGGIDSENTTQRVSVPSGIMANVIERMGLEMGCRVSNAEFSIPASERKWLKSVELVTEPRDVNFKDVPADIQKIKQDISYLHQQLLGEKLEAGDPELERTYKLFVDVWEHGKKNVVPVEGEFPGNCVADRNYITGLPLAEEQRVWSDATYTGRAWAAVFAFMLTDYNFVYE